ncbi:MAG: Ig-like domain-containing protein [Bacteroidales bacterium]|nr:Ig-like domain-containing protein [Bacteroidales bacterium]
MKNHLIYLIVRFTAFSFIFMSCDKDPKPNNPELPEPSVVPVIGVTLSQATAALNIDDTLILTATVFPDSASNKTVSWSSSDSTVASVVNGKITALTAGSTNIIVITQDGNKRDTCQVTVTPTTIPVESVTLCKTVDTLIVDETLILTATVWPSTATNQTVTWSSSTPSVATVLNGVVTAVAQGSAVITVTTADGNKTATCTITVILPPVPPIPPVDVPTCNNDTTGWSTKFGVVSFASPQTWTISAANGAPQTIWSDVVQATNCNKDSHNGGTSGNWLSDCRSNPDYPGNLFSWCAVARFRETLCPDDWRVPTRQDFIDLDKAMGGSGEPRQNALVFINANYLNLSVWGGRLQGGCLASGGLSGDQGRRASYWTQSDYSATWSTTMNFDTDGNVNPWGYVNKGSGFALRCVR